MSDTDGIQVQVRLEIQWYRQTESVRLCGVLLSSNRSLNLEIF